MVPEIPKYYIFIIKNFLVVVTLMAYGRVHTGFSDHESSSLKLNLEGHKYWIYNHHIPWYTDNIAMSETPT